jgi:hypothetical protein
MKKKASKKMDASPSLLLQAFNRQRAAREAAAPPPPDRRSRGFPRLVPPDFMPPAGECAEYATDMGHISQNQSHVTVEYLPKKVNIPEPDAFPITSSACLVNRTDAHKLYLLKNGEWEMRMITPLMARILEHLFRYREHPANRRGRRVKDMRNLCGSKQERNADSVISRGIKQINTFCKTEGIPPFLMQGEEERWYFHKY